MFMPYDFETIFLHVVSVMCLFFSYSVVVHIIYMIKINRNPYQTLKKDLKELLKPNTTLCHSPTADVNF